VWALAKLIVLILVAGEDWKRERLLDGRHIAVVKMATASANSVYLVYSSDDGRDWSNYLAGLLTQVDLQVTPLQLDTCGSLQPPPTTRSGRGASGGSTVVVLLASPGLLSSLQVRSVT